MIITREFQPKQYVTFRVMDLFFGLDVLDIQEFLLTQHVTRVPLASKVISGLINLRGQIVTAIDLRLRLNLPARSAEERPLNIVVRSEGGASSLLVDAIGDVVEVDGSAHELPPASFPSELKEVITTVCKVGEQLLLVVDRGKLLQIPSLSPAK